MIDPGTIGSAIGAALKAKAALDARAMKAEVKRIGAAVDDIGRHLADITKSELLAGLENLKVATETTDTQVRETELGLARQRFGSLAVRSPDDRVLGRYGDLSANHVRAAAQLGNYYYFLVRGDEKQALIHGYRCAEEYPALAVEVLPVALFSRNWHVEAERTRQRRQELMLAVAQTAAVQSTAARRSWRWDMAWRVPAAAGVLVAGLAGAAVSPSLAARGMQGAVGILSTTEQGLLPPSKFDRHAYLAAAATTQDAYAPVVEEARERRLAVEARLSAGP
jgi:hypothetical protein